MSIKAVIKNNTKITKLIFFLTVTIVGCIVLLNMPRISLPLAVAYVLTLLLRPIIPMIMKFGIRKDFAIVTMFIGLGFFLIYPIIKITPTLQKESENLQYYVPKIEKLLRTQYVNIRTEVKERIGLELPPELVNELIVYAKNSVSEILLQIPNVIASVLEWLFLVPLFLFFLIRDGRKFRNNFLRFVPNQIFERAYYLVYQFNRQIGDYIFAKFVEATIVGLVMTIGLYFLDVRFAILLGLAAGLTNIIPYLGPVLGLIPGVIIAFIDYGISPGLGAVVILYAAANIIDLAFVFPILISKIVDLHPIIVVVSVILGSQYMGVAGMIVSIPLAASLKLIFREIYKELYPESTRSL